MIKPLQLPLRAMEKRHLLWWLRYHLSPCSGGHYGCSALCHMTIPGSIERPILPLNRVASELGSHQ